MAYVCNVQTWGSGPTYTEGDLIPEDCPYDVEAAAQQKIVVTTDEYQQAHPDWDPKAQAKTEAEAAAMAEVFPGYDPPTAAEMPDPVATKAMYDDAAAEAEGAQPKKAAPEAKPAPSDPKPGVAPSAPGGPKS